MGRSGCCSKDEDLNKGAWTAMEDKILTEYIKIHGEGKWRQLPKKAGLKRCGKSCRLRWLNYLRPGIKRGNITHDEQDLIIRLHNLLGNRWSLIAGRLPGRTDNEIKNYWNTNIGRKFQNGTSNCSITSGLAQKDHNRKTQECEHPNKSSRVVRTRARRLTKVKVANEVTQQNEGTENKVKGYPVSPSSECNVDPLGFMADFEMDGNFFSELLDIDFTEPSCLGTKIPEHSGPGNPTTTFDNNGYLSPESSNVPWPHSFYHTQSDFHPIESAFD